MNPPGKNNFIMEDHQYITIYCRRCGFQHKFPLYCGSRLCPVCKKRNYLRLLAKYVPLITSVKKYRLTQITLTYKNFKYLTSSKVARVSKDIKKMRRLSVFRDVRGGLAVIECKHVSDEAGWNLHVHMLVDSRYIPQAQLRSDWLRVSQGSYIVDIRREKISSYNSARHLFKYFLKCPVIRGLDEDSLKGDFNIAFRGSRNVIAFGSFYNAVLPDEYRFKCPSCGSFDWLSEYEMVFFESISVRAPPSLVSISISEHPEV